MYYLQYGTIINLNHHRYIEVGCLFQNCIFLSFYYSSHNSQRMRLPITIYAYELRAKEHNLTPVYLTVVILFFFIQKRKGHVIKPKLNCFRCGKTFGSKWNLDRHIVLHTGNHKYICTLCGRRCVTKDNFEGHLNMHADLKPFQCRRCLKCFAYKNKLSAHKKECPDIGNQTI